MEGKAVLNDVGIAMIAVMDMGEERLGASG